MNDRKHFDDEMIIAIAKKKGIMDVQLFSEEHRQKLLELEHDAEERGLMGFGKVVNTGVSEVLKCDLLYVCLTNMDFDWAPYPSLVLKRGDEVIGELIHDKYVIDRICNEKKNTWVAGGNFVIYVEKKSFARDVAMKICQFETPCFPVDWVGLEDSRFPLQLVIFANPATPSDLFLKEQYFKGIELEGIGTILVGVRLRAGFECKLSTERPCFSLS